MSGNLFPMQVPLRSKDDYIYARNLLASVFSSYHDQEGDLIMIVDRPFRAPSDKQRKGLHAWFGEIASHTGHTLAEIKGYCMATFASPRIVELGGKQAEVVPSFTDLTKDEVTELMARVQAWASLDLGVNLV